MLYANYVRVKRHYTVLYRSVVSEYLNGAVESLVPFPYGFKSSIDLNCRGETTLTIVNIQSTLSVFVRICVV